MLAEAADEMADIGHLLDGIRSRYGYDFSHYAYASLKRRLERTLKENRLTRFAALLDALVRDERRFDDFLWHMSVTVTEMFRDPSFYAALRAKIVPLLKTFPFVKIWLAGCATGEEAYSVAVLLREEGFLERARIYATDFNKRSLEVAKEGVYSASYLKKYAANYAAAGGQGAFADYTSEGYGLMKMKDALKERITFSYHNLVSDGVFGEMHLICCRNVLIYFDKTLQNRVLSLFAESLRHGGFLCLGTKESLHFTVVKDQFKPMDLSQRIYRKRAYA